MSHRLHLLEVAIILQLIFCCVRRGNETTNSESLPRIDSITIWYHKEDIKPGGFIFEDRATMREDFMLEDANAAIQIKDSLILDSLYTLIKDLRPRDQMYVEERVITKCALVVHKGDVLDTLALSCLPPPKVQVKHNKYIDSVCEDSLLCKTVWDMIAQRDTFWLNYCADGGWYKEFWL